MNAAVQVTEAERDLRRWLAENPARPPQPHYAGVVAVKRAVVTARNAGIDVGGVELRADGTIAIFDRETAVAIAAKEIEYRIASGG